MLDLPILSYAGQLEDAVTAIGNEEYEKAYELLCPLADEGYADARIVWVFCMLTGLELNRIPLKGCR